ncbi:MAG: helix-turn-helix domain-containing protein [Clostridiales bacterium]|jgi:hypothetical protein|nr:helix-turn-helix domain-containing protein [Clostridiales bacterium]
MNLSNQIPEVLTRKEASSLIRICLTSLDRMRLPVIRIGRRVFYSRTTLENWLAAHEQIKETNTGRTI